MNGKEKQEFIESLISDIDKTTDIRLRKNVYIYTTIPNKQIENIKKYVAEGWEVDKEFKTKIRLKLKKEKKRLLVDKIWVLFA